MQVIGSVRSDALTTRDIQELCDHVTEKMKNDSADRMQAFIKSVS